MLKKKKRLEQKFNKKIIFLNMTIIDIYSTNIRKNIKQGRDINYLLPKDVGEIIDKLQLYK